MRHVITLVVILGGCAAPHKDVPRDAYRVQSTIDFRGKSFDEVWGALVATFADEGWPIGQIEKASGLIATEWAGLGSRPGWLDCRYSMLSIDRGTGGRFTVLVREAPGTVKMDIRTDFRVLREGIFQSYSSEPCVSTGMLEQRVKVLVNQHLIATAEENRSAAPRATVAEVRGERVDRDWEEIGRWSGTGYEATDRFSIASSEWRVEWKASNPGYGAYMFITVEDESGQAVTKGAVQQGEGSGVLYVPNGRGEFHLEVTAVNLSWEVLVLEKVGN